MGGTERVEELDGQDVPLPTLPEPEAPEPVTPVGQAALSEDDAKLTPEEAYVETFKDAGV